MATVARHSLPRMIERGTTTTLDLTLYDADGAGITPSSGTLTITDGGRTIVDAAAVTAAATSTYSLAGATTADEPLSVRWLELWSMVISGVTYTFRRPAYLCRRLIYPVITDTDLTDLYADVVAILPSGTSDWSEKREAAWGMILRELIKRGKNPGDVIDSFALLDMHRHLTLALIYGEAAISVGTDGRYAERSTYHLDAYRREWDTVTYTYDADRDGAIDAGEQDTPATSAVWLSRPRATTSGRL